MKLENKVIVITGASSGIGKSLAEILSERDVKLALLARREDKLAELEHMLKKKNTNVISLCTDVTDKSQVQEAIMNINKVFGNIDIVINNAGVGYFGTIENLPLDEFDRLIKTNIYGVINISQECIPYLKKSRGMIVNISSGLSKRALPFLSAYSSTKSMLDALSDGMRLELKRYGIKVLNYCPPETETEIFNNTRHEPGLTNSTSHRKKAKVEDVANRIIIAIINERREVVEGRFLQIMNFFAPKVLDKIFYKGMVEKILK